MTREQQEKEIETIKGRQIILNLSDADVDGIYELCAGNGITVSALLENFIRDLVGGNYSNGSDERDFADNYFFRVLPNFEREHSLIAWMMLEGAELLDLYYEIENGRGELEAYEKNPEPWDEEEIGYLKTNLEDWENEFNEYKSQYLTEYPDADWDEEFEFARKCWQEKEVLIYGV